jgi:hypothetical protein
MQELHGRNRTPKQLARMAKNSEETFGFAAEWTGFKHPTDSLGKTEAPE